MRSYGSRRISHFTMCSPGTMTQPRNCLPCPPKRLTCSSFPSSFGSSPEKASRSTKLQNLSRHVSIPSINLPSESFTRTI